jgi:hypothetical protein
MFLAVVCSLAGPAEGRGQVSDEERRVATEEAIGGLAMNLLISTNLNVGLAAEFRTANAKVSIDVLTMTENTLNVNLKQLAAYGQKAQLAKHHRRYLDLCVDGLKAVVAQSEALRKAIASGDSQAIDQYNAQRQKVQKIIQEIKEN